MVAVRIVGLIWIAAVIHPASAEARLVVAGLADFDYSKFEARVEMYGRYGWNHPSLVLKAVFDYPSSIAAFR